MLNDLDISNEDCLISILKRDKHAVLEGNCIENLFLKDVISYINSNLISSNWWFVGNPEYKYIGVKIIHSYEPSLTDNEIFNYLSLHIPCFFLKYNKNESNFVVIKNSIEIQNILKWDLTQCLNTQIEVKNNKRQDESIELLKTLGILEETAIERLFANSVLNNNGLWDVDYFLMEDNHLKVLEIKQKYPKLTNRFGLNEELANLFKWLIHNEIQIFHIILTKPIWDKYVPSLDFVTDKRYFEKCLWVGTELKNNELIGKVKTAPTETSIDGNHRQNYIDINIDKVSVIKKFNSYNGDKFKDFLQNKSPLIPIKKIPRLEIRYYKRDDLMKLFFEMEFEFLKYGLNDELVIRNTFNIMKLELAKDIPNKLLIKEKILNLNREKISDKLLFTFMDLLDGN